MSMGGAPAGPAGTGGFACSNIYIQRHVSMKYQYFLFFYLIKKDCRHYIKMLLVNT